MIGIVIITHGQLSQVLAETAQLIMGEQESLIPVTFAARESVETLRTKAMASVEPFAESGCLVLTDVLGGSATNICVELLKIPWIRIVTGVNLPMVMEALNHRQTSDLLTLSRKVRDGGARGILDLKDFYEQRAQRKK